MPASKVVPPGVSETFPFPTQLTGGPAPVAFFDVGRGSAVLLLHGLCGNFTHWEHVAPLLARDHRVIGVDFPGCGDSHRRRDRAYTLCGCVESAIRVLDHLQIDQAVFCGHSLGGLVSCMVAHARPERVAGLVLIDTAGFHEYGRATGLATRLLHPRLLSPALFVLAWPLLARLFHQENDRTRKFVGQVLGRPVYPTVDELAEQASSLLPDTLRHTPLPHLERIVQPALVIWGARDRLLPFAPVPRGAARLPNGRLAVIPECGHMPIVERPSEVMDEVRPFLAGLAGSPPVSSRKSISA